MCVCFIIAWELNFGLPSAGQTLQDASEALSAASEALRRHPVGDDDLWYHYITHGNFLPSFFQIFSWFLDASSHLYKRVCPSVRPSVGPSVGPSVRPSVG